MARKPPQFVYTANITELEGKNGKLPKDANGYYEILVGAFNVYNSAYEFYEMTAEVDRLFHRSSDLMTRTRSNKVYGENDHPDFTPFMGKPNAVQLFLDRCRDIQLKNAAVHFKDFRLEALTRQEKGQTCIGVYASARPKTEFMRDSFDNPHENTSFSVRAFCDKVDEGLETIKRVNEIVTYDGVTSGGITEACKYKTPTMESITGGVNLSEYGFNESDLIITKKEIDFLAEADRAREEALAAGVTFESTTQVKACRIRDLYGKFREVPTLDLGFNKGEEVHISRMW